MTEAAMVAAGEGDGRLCRLQVVLFNSEWIFRSGQLTVTLLAVDFFSQGLERFSLVGVVDAFQDVLGLSCLAQFLYYSCTKWPVALGEITRTCRIFP